ncbi:MAG: glutaredoxin domain-containing protein [Nocardioides sp.]
MRNPFRRPTATSHAEASEHAAAGGVVVYWRPGCPFCMILRTAVSADADKAAWVNIWDDPDAAAYVRSVNDGNETVPTVVIDGAPHTNPAPGLVAAALAAAG